MIPALYDSGQNGFWVFLLVTIAMGGSAAWATGRAIADTWRPPLHLVAYAGLLAAAVRFIQYALFQQPLLAANSFAVDFLILLLLALFGYRVRRVRQMVEQYPWQFVQVNALLWRQRGHS